MLNLPLPFPSRLSSPWAVVYDIRVVLFWKPLLYFWLCCTHAQLAGEPRTWFIHRVRGLLTLHLALCDFPCTRASGALFIHSYSHKYGVLSVLVSCLSCLEMKWQEEKKNRDSSILFFSPGAVFLLPLLRAVIFLLWFLVVTLQQCGFMAGAGFSTGGRNERKSECLLTSSRSLLPQ